MKIISEFIDKLSDDIMKNRLKIVAPVKEKYAQQLQNVFERRCLLLLDRIIVYIADLDTGVNFAKDTQKYNHKGLTIIDACNGENFYKQRVFAILL